MENIELEAVEIFAAMNADDKQFTLEQLKGEFKPVAYWDDGYFIFSDDALEQAELLDSVNAFGGEHRVMRLPVATNDADIRGVIAQALKAKSM